MLKMVEIYDSVKGEGTQAGIPMTFVRFAKCNLACDFCDTPYNRVAFEINEEPLIKMIIDRKPAWVIFTGGEPLLQLTANITSALKAAQIMLAIETNGTIYNECLQDIDYINVSPKKGIDGGNISDDLVQAVKTGRIDIAETRFIIDGPHGDVYETGLEPTWITVSPMMHDPAPLTTEWKSGMGHPSMSGVVDQASLARCLHIVKRDRHERTRLSVQVHKFIQER